AETRVRMLAARRNDMAGLGLHVLEVRLGAERVARVALHDLGGPAERDTLHRTLSDMRGALAASRLPAVPPRPRSLLARALTALATLLGESPSAEPAPLPAPATPPGAAWRPALQSAIAGGLAIGAGELVSPSRWYWAAFAAFVMFQGTRSRGESLAKVGQYTVGTLAGVVGGVLLAVALFGHELLTLAVIVGAVFLAFQAYLTAYAVMVFWITIILGLMFGMLGYFAPELLLLRLEETLAGAVCGIAVTCLVLVRPTHAVVTAARTAFLRALGALVDAVAGVLLDARAPETLPGLILELEQQTRNLVAAAHPELVGLGRLKHKTLRRQMMLLDACAGWARELGRIGLHGRRLGDDTLRATVRAAADSIEASIA
ncbi:MAG: FUSC family protein, partial [Acetobacteraceae bacterium]